MHKLPLLFSLIASIVVAPALAQNAQPRTIHALLIAGGCCHDYAHQQEAICQGIQGRANVQVDVYWTDNTTTSPVLPLYDRLNWSEYYDVIIHDECAADVKDPALLNRIIQTHQKLPAVHLHCAMHSFRTGSDAWFKHLGLQSSGHGPQEPIAIHFVDSQHPITATLSDWTTIREELYNNVQVLGAHPLAVGKQQIGGDTPRTEEAIVAWTNEGQGARSFSTTIGHNTETVEDPRYLELITRGLLWACGKLTPEYLTPYHGKNEETFIDKNKFRSPEAADLGQQPQDATLVKLTASSTQSGHPPHHAIDGNRETRWCANGDGYPQSLTCELEKPAKVTELQIVWEFPDNWYQYQVEGSVDGKNWLVLLDNSNATAPINKMQPLKDQSLVKFIRITASKAAGGWCSIRELTIKGEGIGTLWPADADSEKFVPMQGDVYANQGNIPPRIERLTSEQEAAILSDVQVPNDFQVTVFASPPAVNYPVFVAASVDGTVFVSSDGNGSLGRNARRGRVIRLRDLDGDGRADETKVFCEVDAPRGLVWDHDRLYLMHPPNLSVFIDADGDGVADEQRTLVKNLAFGYDKRPADHTTNGVSLGVDGWLYIAGGDFGFLNAEGTDGRRVTHRGGGVIRVRPDGTGLEVYSTGTRNILEVAISPQMEMFARDNTNDGGGWDVRLHHFTGMDNHGYPRLFKNFNDECVQPLADYGGGSGCGAVYIDEPGFGKWNDAPFTADWGTGSLFRHTVSRSGATFRETAKPESFIKLTRPTDADVDGNSRVYCASWRGATFDWNGPDVGYIVCVTPRAFQPTPMPNFAKASDEQLMGLLNTPSYRRRVEAQRELLRRGNPAYQRLLDQSASSRGDLRNLLDVLQTDATDSECVAALGLSDPLVVHTAIRCLASRNAFKACFDALDTPHADSKQLLRSLAMMHRSEVVNGLIDRLQKANRAQKNEILAALCRLYFEEGKWEGDSWGTRPDTRGPYYQPEKWSQTEKIDAVLRKALESLAPDDVAALLQTMHLNRIQSSDALDRMLQLAMANDEMLGPTIAQLAQSNEVPSSAMLVLLKGAALKNASPSLLADTCSAMSKLADSSAIETMLDILVRLDATNNSDSEQDKARFAFLNAPRLDNEAASLAATAKSSSGRKAIWAEAALLAIASKPNASPESREVARAAIDSGWQENTRRGRLMQVAARIQNHYLDDRIWQAREDADPTISKIAQQSIEQLKIKPPVIDDSPKIQSLELAAATDAVVAMEGDAAIGLRVFTKANCAACHTTRQDEPQKGPFLGNIAKTYKRPDLAISILDPNKTIAQGFATNSILTTDGVVLTGYVTNEQSDRVTMRDQQGKEFTVMKDDIDERKTSTTSIMPTGLMNDYTTHELASLLDYLESLAK